MGIPLMVSPVIPGSAIQEQLAGSALMQDSNVEGYKINFMPAHVGSAILSVFKNVYFSSIYTFENLSSLSISTIETMDLMV